jgi:hypothetical protein
MTKNQIVATFTDRNFYSKIELKSVFHSDEALPVRIDLSKSYCFWNPITGTGKTKRATLFLRDWLCQQFPEGFELWNYHSEPIVIDMSRFEKIVEDRFGFSDDDKGRAKMVIDDMKTAKLLILDDFWLSSGTERFVSKIKTTLFEIFDYRSNHKLQTIVTTNLDLIQVYESISDQNDIVKKYLSRMLSQDLCKPVKVKGDVDMRMNKPVEPDTKPPTIQGSEEI